MLWEVLILYFKYDTRNKAQDVSFQAQMSVKTLLFIKEQRTYESDI